MNTPAKPFVMPPAPPPDLRGIPADALTALVGELGEPPYRAEQLFRWLHKSAVTELDAMGNLPKMLRAQLAERTRLTTLTIDTVQTSEDGTRKLRLRCADGAMIESVLIPRAERELAASGEETEKLTLCVSSQVGCALGCAFCATATLGLKRNLEPGEIVEQIYRAHSLLSPRERISNLVFMGMGEPLANLDRVLTAVELLTHTAGFDFSPRRITLSTVGHVNGIKKLGERMPQLGLAISLHATTDDLRAKLMPVNRRWPLAALFAALRAYPLPRRRRITFEYMLLAGLNDTAADANRLTKLLDRIPSKINILPFNPWRQDQPELKRPSEEDIDIFAERLRDKGLTVTVRQSRGRDIAAACGQLALDADRS